MHHDLTHWQELSLPFGAKLHEALHLQHHAAQFIALCGRHLLPRQPDDSNTNMEYLPEHKLLAGNPLNNGLRVSLHLPDLTLCLLDENTVCPDRVSLSGKTKKEVFDELKNLLRQKEIDVAGFTDKLHYTILPHPLDQGASFHLPEGKYLKENTIMRHNADAIIRKIADQFPGAAEVRVWPHHFDTGTFIPVRKDADGKVTVSFGIGWAIPDTMVDEPYFYLSVWAETPFPDMNTLSSPETGEWITSGWSGGVLKHSEILAHDTAETQEKTALAFFRSGLEILNKNVK